FGKWIAGAEVLNWCSSPQAYFFIGAGLLGAAATADLRVAHIIFGPTRVLSFFLCTVLPIRFTRALIDGGFNAMHGQVKSIYKWLIPAIGIYCLLIAIFPAPILRLMFKDKYAASASVLSLFAIVSLLSYLSMVVMAALTAQRMTRDI